MMWRAGISWRGAACGALAAAAILWIFLVPEYWVFTATVGIPLAISVLGLMVVVGWAGEVSLVQAGLTGTAVYLCGYAFRADGWGWPFLAAAGVGIVAAVGLSLILALGTSKLSGIYILVMTLALQMTIERAIFRNNYRLTGGIHGVEIPRPALPGVSLESDRAFYLFCLAVLGGVLLMLARLRSSRFGRALLLVGTDRRAAASVGVSPWRYKTFAFILAAVLAGVAGSLLGPLMRTPPSKEAPGLVAYTAFQSLYYLAIPVLAGFGSLLAVVAVAVAFTLIPLALEPYRISPLILGGVGLALGTLIGRAGVTGVVSDQLRAWRRRHAEARPEIKRGTEPGLRELAAYGAQSSVRDDGRRQALEILEAYLPPPPEAEVALAAQGISVSFDGLTVLSDVAITVPARQVVGLIGPNGAGKSTLFDVLNGLLRPDCGTVHLFGRDVTGLRAWDRAALGLGRTFQAHRIDLHQSVRDNLLAGAYTTAGGSLPGVLLGLPGSGAGMRRAEEAAWAVAQLFAIDRYWDERPVALSFGNRRRVEIGRTLMARPRLLLLDEPTAGLDPTASAILLSLMNELQTDLGLTVLLVEHYVRAVLENCDLVYVLAQGEVVAVGSPADVVSHPEVRSKYLGADFLLGTAGRGA